MPRRKTITLTGPALQAFISMQSGIAPKTERERAERYATRIFMSLSEDDMEMAVRMLLQFRNLAPLPG